MATLHLIPANPELARILITSRSNSIRLLDYQQDSPIPKEHLGKLDNDEGRIWHDDIIIFPDKRVMFYLHSGGDVPTYDVLGPQSYFHPVEGVYIDHNPHASTPKVFTRKGIRLCDRDEADYAIFIPNEYLADPAIVKWRLLGDDNEN